LAAGTALLLLGCGSSRRTDENGGNSDPDAGDAGRDATIGLECSDLVDEAPSITPGCPVGSEVCPTAPECESCATCADPTGMGAPLVDGLYELRSVVAYISACGMWNATLATGTLRVSGSTIDLVWTRPWLGDGARTQGGRYSFRVEGEELVVDQLCPTEGAETTRVPYATANGVLYFPDSFPDPEVFSLVFAKR
jgi:hypothetical protein